MTHVRLWCLWSSGAIIAFAVCLFAPPSLAREPFEAFLEGLRQRQMFDSAREYAESMRTSPLLSEELKATIPFELGRISVEEARTQQNVTDRLNLLDEARTQFEQFLKAAPEHPLAAETSLELGNVLVERGRAYLETSRRPSEVAARPQHLTDARNYFEQAQKVFADAETRFDAELKKYPAFIDSKEADKLEARNRALLNTMQARLLKATVIYESAATFEEATPQRTKLLEEAAAAYAAIYEQYQRRLAGLYARMYQGRCFQDLGNTKQALTYYSELLAQPDDPDEFRVLKRKTLRLAMMCWLDDSEKKYDEVIRQGEAWLGQARGSEPQTTEGLAIRWLTALGYEQRALAYDGDDPRRTSDHRQAVNLATAVAQYRGDHQDDARSMLTRLRPRAGGEGSAVDFAGALAAGKSALDTMSAAQAKVRILERTGSEATKLDEARTEIAAAQATALEEFRHALVLRTPDVSLDEVNQARYFLCYLHYVSGNHRDAAVLGEFLAERYPESAGAKPAAKIALASYLALYNSAPPDDRDFESTRMVELADKIARRWPGSEEADEAWMILSDLALRTGEYSVAAKYLENVRPDSPRRSEADVKAGQALWAAYLAAARLDESRPSTEELNEMSADARALLERGLKKRLAGSAGEPTYAELTAELSLAQIYLESGDYDQATALLERPNSGALALLAANNPLTAQGNFSSEAYKAGLRAFVGAGQLDKAEAVMKILDTRASESNESAAALTQIYVSLGIELKEQVARLQKEKKDAELKVVLKTFHEFLDRIAGREQGNTFNSLAWVGETFFSLGEGLGDDQPPSAEAKQYFARAAKTCEQILARAKTDPNFAPQPSSLLGVRLRLAKCERRLGNYTAARNQIATLLGEQPNSLEGQVEAAYVYQAWGSEDPDSYRRANRGQKLKLGSGQIVEIWGWSGIATRVRDNERYRDFYYEAQFNLALCSYMRAMSSTGEERSAELQGTTRVIVLLAKLHPDLGGDAWHDKFDTLLKKVQRELGERPLGLQGLVPHANSQDTARRAG